MDVTTAERIVINGVFQRIKDTAMEITRHLMKKDKWLLENRIELLMVTPWLFVKKRFSYQGLTPLRVNKHVQMHKTKRIHAEKLRHKNYANA